jgi:RNA polymerase sigma factor (sigma-70 family)
MDESRTGHTARLQNRLERMRDGHLEAKNEVIEHTGERLRALTHRMLRGYPGVRRWTETDDVLQNSLIRLHRALATVQPESPGQFYGLAAMQIRRELIDLARRLGGPEGLGAKHHTDGGEAAERHLDCRSRPDSLEDWTAFHEAVEALSEEQRQVVDLLWYDRLTQPEAALVLGISLKTVKRRWQSARLLLRNALADRTLD